MAPVWPRFIDRRVTKVYDVIFTYRKILPNVVDSSWLRWAAHFSRFFLSKVWYDKFTSI